MNTIVSIKDVAKKAGVSVATVSRVMNQTDVVSEETTARVLAAAKELGYSPNLLGRSLRRRKTKVIMVMLSSLLNTFCAKVVRGIEKAADAKGFSTMICITGDSPEREKKYFDIVKNKMADGIIVINSTLSAEQMQKLSGEIPIVQCSEYSDTAQTPFVSIDNEAAAFEAVSYLIGKGKKRVVFIGVDNGLISSKLRFAGYRRALEEAEIPFDENLLLWGNYGYRHSTRVMTAFLRKQIPFDAVFAISDKMAAGAITALSREGIRVPQDVGVIGFDNTEITYIFQPNITTVSQPQNEMGETAFQLLYALLTGKKTKNVILKHKLVERKSTQS